LSVFSASSVSNVFRLQKQKRRSPQRTQRKPKSQEALSPAICHCRKTSPLL
jgi:hypothetical protein